MTKQYELSYFAEYWIVVMVGTLEQCQDYARKFKEWNNSSNFLIRDLDTYDQYYFTESYELIPTSDYR